MLFVGVARFKLLMKLKGIKDYLVPAVLCGKITRVIRIDKGFAVACVVFTGENIAEPVQVFGYMVEPLNVFAHAVNELYDAPDLALRAIREPCVCCDIAFARMRREMGSDAFRHIFTTA